MFKQVAALIWMAAVACSAANAWDRTAESKDTAAVYARLQSATWPSDIVQLSDRLLTLNPPAAWAQVAQSLRLRAEAPARVLNSNKAFLQRSAFTASDLSPESAETLRAAALGDPAAAVRLARLYQRNADRVPSDRFRYLGWLQFAALLGDDSAAYELALYFRKDGQPAMAAIYETRAASLGFAAPIALDNIRK
jgi:TPR repeat protein